VAGAATSLVAPSVIRWYLHPLAALIARVPVRDFAAALLSAQLVRRPPADMPPCALLFIVNPTSGLGDAVRVWAKARSALRERGIEYEERFTERRGHATALAREALGRGCRRVVAVGGDGTLSEVVNGYFDEAGEVIDRHAALGLLPAGTGSDFGRTIGLSTREAALDAILGEARRQLDVLSVESQDAGGRPCTRRAINVVSLGLGGDVVARIEAWRERWPRWAGRRALFVAAAVRALTSYRTTRVRVTLDDGVERTVRSGFLVIANGRYAGAGMKLAPEADPADGLCDVVLTDGVTRWDVIRELPRITRGAHRSHPGVTLYRTRAVTVEADEPLPLDVDGDPAGSTPLRVTVVPSAVGFLCP
jgi:diacylglycerol kinase (ATP)